MVMALRSKWAVGKAVRAILPIARLDSLLYLLLNRARSGSLIVRVKGLAMPEDTRTKDAMKCEVRHQRIR
jgi:hypothetical protein